MASLHILVVTQLSVLVRSKLNIILILTLMSICGSQAFAANSDAKKSENRFQTIAWEDLIPEDEYEILSNPPSYLDEIEDGSVEDQISSQLNNAIAQAEEDRYQQALVSTNIRSEMDGKAVRIPGFVVPLEFNNDQTITEFFLVPYFGACIHMPPPPPNQIIHVKYPQGLRLDALYNPFWITGVMRASLVMNDMATSAYAIEMAGYEDYTR